MVSRDPLTIYIGSLMESRDHLAKGSLLKSKDPLATGFLIESIMTLL